MRLSSSIATTAISSGRHTKFSVIDFWNGLAQNLTSIEGFPQEHTPGTYYTNEGVSVTLAKHKTWEGAFEVKVESEGGDDVIRFLSAIHRNAGKGKTWEIKTADGERSINPLLDYYVFPPGDLSLPLRELFHGRAGGFKLEREADLFFLGDLAVQKRSVLAGLPKIGQTLLNNCDEVLQKYGLQFGMGYKEALKVAMNRPISISRDAWEEGRPIPCPADFAKALRDAFPKSETLNEAIPLGLFEVGKALMKLVRFGYSLKHLAELRVGELEEMKLCAYYADAVPAFLTEWQKLVSKAYGLPH